MRGEGVYYTAKVEYWVARDIYRISGTDACLKQYLYIDPKRYHAEDEVEIAEDNKN